MEYIVSARKYRPMTFSSVVGQTALTSTLKNAVKNRKLAHAFLFCGPRGVGKTTCARIFAKTINCENVSPDGEACNECESCRAFNEQRSLNIFELDAASNNGVEHIKALMDQTRVPPQLGRYKVFIIDEVHMLSPQAFNAFLKTLEEPPSYVIFILATTEKHKILPTIISRCQIYDFERMDVPHTVSHLKMVAGKEGVTYEDEALNLIAEKADGGMRDALSIFDQCVSFCGGNLTYEKVLQNLNVLDSENYFKLVDLSLQNKVPDVMVLLNEIIENGFDGGQFVNGLASHLRNVLMAKNPGTLPLIEASDRLKTKFGEQAQKCPAKFIYQALRYCNECDVNYKASSNKRLLVELTLIEIAQITQEDEAGAGRRPKKSLKSLFKKLVASGQKNAAAQVAATGRMAQRVMQAPKATPAPQTPESTSTTSLNPPAVSQTVSTNNTPPLTPPARPTLGMRLKSGGFSTSFKQMGMAKEEKTVVDEAEITNKEENSQFTQEDLSREWLSMCNRMMAVKELIGFSQRLKNVQPKITQHPNIELVIDNKQLLDQAMSYKNRLRMTMAKYLHNGNIGFNIRLAEANEVKPILSRREIFEKLRRENHAIEQLAELLDLDMA